MITREAEAVACVEVSMEITTSVEVAEGAPLTDKTMVISSVVEDPLDVETVEIEVVVEGAWVVVETEVGIKTSSNLATITNSNRTIENVLAESPMTVT